MAEYKYNINGKDIIVLVMNNISSLIKYDNPKPLKYVYANVELQNYDTSIIYSRDINLNAEYLVKLYNISEKLDKRIKKTCKILNKLPEYNTNVTDLNKQKGAKIHIINLIAYSINKLIHIANTKNSDDRYEKVENYIERYNFPVEYIEDGNNYKEMDTINASIIFNNYGDDIYYDTFIDDTIKEAYRAGAFITIQYKAPRNLAKFNNKHLIAKYADSSMRDNLETEDYRVRYNESYDKNISKYINTGNYMTPTVFDNSTSISYDAKPLYTLLISYKYLKPKLNLAELYNINTYDINNKNETLNLKRTSIINSMPKAIKKMLIGRVKKVNDNTYKLNGGCKIKNKQQYPNFNTIQEEDNKWKFLSNYFIKFRFIISDINGRTFYTTNSVKKYPSWNKSIKGSNKHHKYKFFWTYGVDGSINSISYSSFADASIVNIPKFGTIATSGNYGTISSTKLPIDCSCNIIGVTGTAKIEYTFGVLNNNLSDINFIPLVTRYSDEFDIEQDTILNISILNSNIIEENYSVINMNKDYIFGIRIKIISNDTVLVPNVSRANYACNIYYIDENDTEYAPKFLCQANTKVRVTEDGIKNGLYFVNPDVSIKNINQYLDKNRQIHLYFNVSQNGGYIFNQGYTFKHSSNYESISNSIYPIDILTIGNETAVVKATFGIVENTDNVNTFISLATRKSNAETITPGGTTITLNNTENVQDTYNFDSTTGNYYLAIKLYVISGTYNVKDIISDNMYALINLTNSDDGQPIQSIGVQTKKITSDSIYYIYDSQTVNEIFRSCNSETLYPYFTVLGTPNSTLRLPYFNINFESSYEGGMPNIKIDGKMESSTQSMNTVFEIVFGIIDSTNINTFIPLVTRRSEIIYMSDYRIYYEFNVNDLKATNNLIINSLYRDYLFAIRIRTLSDRGQIKSIPNLVTDPRFYGASFYFNKGGIEKTYSMKAYTRIDSGNTLGVYFIFDAVKSILNEIDNNTVTNIQFKINNGAKFIKC